MYVEANQADHIEVENRIPEAGMSRQVMDLGGGDKKKKKIGTARKGDLMLEHSRVNVIYYIFYNSCKRVF